MMLVALLIAALSLALALLAIIIAAGAHAENLKLRARTTELAITVHQQDAHGYRLTQGVAEALLVVTRHLRSERAEARALEVLQHIPPSGSKPS